MKALDLDAGQSTRGAVSRLRKKLRCPSGIEERRSGMCGMCGLLGGGTHWSNAGVPDDGATRRQRRLLQVALANRILESFRLRLDDFHGQSFVLSSPTGAMELVADFTEVWRTAEQMLGKPLDPLALFEDEGT
jgi:hypothetical protein